MRRSALSTFVPAIVVVAVIASAVWVAHGVSPGPAVRSGASANSPWAQSDANASASRTNPAETTLTTTTVKKVVFRRSLVQPPNTSESCGSTPVAAPALSGGKVYTAGDGYVTAYTASTGDIVWQTDATLAGWLVESYGSVAVGNGFVYVQSSGCESPDDAGDAVTAYSATTGKLAWFAEVGGDTPGGSMQLSSNYIVLSGSASNDGQVTSVYQAATGNLVWSTDGESCRAGAEGAIVVAAEVIWNNCNETDDGTAVLEADSLSTGSVLWTRAGSWSIIRGDSDGAATGHHIFALDASGTVNDINPKTGATRYTLTGATTVLADDTRIYASCGNGTVCAFDTATGTHEWTVDENQSGIAAEADGVLYLDDGDALVGSTGAVIKQVFTIPYRSFADFLAVGDGRIAVITNDDRIIDLYGLAGS